MGYRNTSQTERRVRRVRVYLWVDVDVTDYECDSPLTSAELIGHRLVVDGSEFRNVGVAGRWTAVPRAMQFIGAQ